MSSDPMVTIIGRPNVGKSSLFNLIMRERIAIEEPTEGVTRDRLICPLNFNGRQIQLVDTGGIGVVDRQRLEEDVGEQIEFAIASADLIIFVLDGSNELTELDRKVAKRVHQCGVQALLVANKVDNEILAGEVSRYMALGFGDAVPISVLHNLGIGDFKRKLLAKIPHPQKKDAKDSEKGESTLRLALAGRRNVGKSSLTNHLCGQKRVIVSDMAGTTRDAIDVTIEHKGQKMTLVDTAGLRKKNQTEDSIEFFSVNRTFGALYRADIGIFMLDAKQGISQVDQKLGRWFADHHKACVLVVNKWDLAEDITDEKEYEDYLKDRLPGLSYVPVVYMSVHEGKGINRLFSVIEEIRKQLEAEPTTGEINEVLQEAQERRRPKKSHGAMPRLFYATRIKTSPPTFLMFGKCTQQVDDNYKRFLASFFRKKLGMTHLPINFVFRNRKSLYK
ncbi:MAG: ribosome biogenesis GTPase Der [Planctomycetes bacterium]|nr:ribosome biogenesis GTPase Der [Planctomycetota bacterium]